MIHRLLREPLLHFFALAVVILAIYGAFGSRRDDADTLIVVSPQRVAQLAAVFAKTWQRPPTDAELVNLVDEFVKEEIYVREAQRMGLDRDDTVIRRRLRVKMEFLSDAEAGLAPPSDAELQRYLDAHAAVFASPPLYSFDQIKLRSAGAGEPAESDVARIVASLNGSTPPDAAALGDATLLPAQLEEADRTAIARVFGDGFADAVRSAPAGVWSGPVASAYGVHAVRLRARKDGDMPQLAAVRDQVLREWSYARKKELEDDRLRELRARYTVRVPTSGAAAP